MVVDLLDPDEIDRVFHALADATRRDIVQRCLLSEHSVSALAREYPMSFAAVQKHVTVLADAGLVTRHRQGRETRVRGNVERIAAANRLLARYEHLWRERLDRFEAVLTETTTTTPDPEPKEAP